MGLKVVSLHSFTHDEIDTLGKDCEICEHVIVSNETDITSNNSVSSTIQIKNLFKEQNFYAHAYKFEQSQIDNSLFCRPPPRL
jgi:restriction endonuclease S subunit